MELYSPQFLNKSYKHWDKVKRPPYPPTPPDNYPTGFIEIINGRKKLCCPKCRKECATLPDYFNIKQEKRKIVNCIKCYQKYATKDFAIPPPPIYPGPVAGRCLWHAPLNIGLITNQKNLISYLKFNDDDISYDGKLDCGTEFCCIGMAPYKEGNIFMLDDYDKQIIVLDKYLDYRKRLLRLDSPGAIAFDPKGDLWISDSDSRIMKYSRKGKKLFEFRMKRERDDDDEPGKANLIAFDSRGNIYAGTKGMIRKYTDQGKLITKWKTSDIQLDLKINKDDVVFFVGDQLVLYSKDGNHLMTSTFSGYEYRGQDHRLAHPEGIAIFPDGKYYVAFPWEGTIKKYDHPYNIKESGIKPVTFTITP